MADSELLTADERLAELGDKLLADVLCSDEVSLSRRRRLFGNLPTKAFRNENFVIYSVLHAFADKRITPDEDFMKLYLMRNTKFFIDNRSRLDMEGDDVDEYIVGVLKQFIRLSGAEKSKSDDEFILNIEKYKSEYSAIEMSNSYTVAREILYDGVQIGRRYYQGFEDSIAYVKKVGADIENVINTSVGDGFVDSRQEGIRDDDKAKTEKISDFDLIDELNEYLGGVYTGLLYNVVAPTKGGKSKFTTRIVHTALVKYGTNVSVWAVEGGYKAWWAQLRAVHFEYMYVRNASEGERVAPLTQGQILKGDYPSEQLRQLEEASRIDLFTNPNYGVLNMIDRPFAIENYAEDIDTSIKLNHSKMLLIDYPQLIEGGDSRRSLPDMVKEVYKRLLRVAGGMNVAVMCPAQYTQDFIKQMSTFKGEGTPETRTSGGESSEVIRSADINIALYASLDDLARKEMSVLSMPSRMVQSFPSFRMYADLSCSLFASFEE